MAKFLNTDQLNEWIPRLIKETRRELVIIVPYIQTSDRIYTHLWEANKRGVEITLVYRENKLSQKEKAKIAALDNLNLMHHPNVHAKCYYNEKYLIITSMNLYEYSERNNREMGILLFIEQPEENRALITTDEDIDVVEDAIHEIRAIINGASSEKESRETIQEGFEMNILKTEKELVEEDCAKLNRIFRHKRFEAVETPGGWDNICRNYFDRLDVTIGRRAELRFSYDETRIKAIFNKFEPYYQEYRFDGFKFYWNHHKQGIYLYIDQRNKMWEEISEEQRIENIKNGIDQAISFLRQFIH